MNIRLLGLLAVLAITAGCYTTTYEIVQTNGAYVENEDLMRLSVRADSSERAAMETQKSRSSAIPRADLDSPIVLLHSDLPNYPGAVQAEGIKGVVEILFTIDIDGRVKKPIIITSPDARLSKVCINAILKWRFKPVTRNGIPVAIEVRQQFPFIL